jgi:hypothetical protein
MTAERTGHETYSEWLVTHVLQKPPSYNDKEEGFSTALYHSDAAGHIYMPE